MKLAPALLAFNLLYAPFFVACAQNAPIPAESAALPRAGEIGLEGRVAALGDGKWTLEATAFINPNGKRATLSEPKSKIISGAATDLQIGEFVTVIGTGNGAILQARATIRSARAIAPDARKSVQSATLPIAATAPASLVSRPGLPPAFAAGDLMIVPIQAGFDYSGNVFPDFQTFERTPVFTSTFVVKSAAAKTTNEQIAQRMVLRRIIGPQNQFVAPFALDILAKPVKGKADVVGFADAGVDPNWDWIDMDVDVIPPPEAPIASGGNIELKDVTLPAPGAETPIDREFTGALGTQFRVVKIRRDQLGQTFVVVHHQKPAALADLELSVYSLKFFDNRQNRDSGNGGGLSNGLSVSGDNELLLTFNKNLVFLPSLTIAIDEKAPSLANRARVTRQRLRYDLTKLRATEKMAPPQIQNPPVELGRAQSSAVEVRVDSDGLSWSGKMAMLLMASKSAPANAQRGLRWSIVRGTAHFDNGAPDAGLQTSDNSMIYLWHSDGTPLSPDETLQKKAVNIPEDAKSYDLKFDLEGRVTLEESFARDIEIPQNKTIVAPPDDGEHGLILRKIQRFSAPSELKNYPDWMRGWWPNAGLALVFEANPQLIGPEIMASALDAEDDQGRELKLGTLDGHSLYKGDMTLPADAQDKRFYTMVVGQPARDAKSVRVWLHFLEKASNVEKASLEMKNIAVTKFDK